jgi:hypothetical protein
MFHRRSILTALFLAVSSSLIAQSSATATQLSPAERKIIDRKIAAIPASQGAGVARQWSNVKKVSEVLCRPAALSALKKKNPAVEKVFLGTSDPATLTLESNERLVGSGQYRIGMNWTEFTFICLIDAATAKVTSFETQTLPKQ